MQSEKNANFQILFKTTSSLNTCHKEHPEEMSMLKEILHDNQNPQSLEKVLLFQNKRLLSSIIDVYGPYSHRCQIYPYDRRFKHGKCAQKIVKKKQADPKFSLKGSTVEVKSEPKLEANFQIKHEGS